MKYERCPSETFRDAHQLEVNLAASSPSFAPIIAQAIARLACDADAWSIERRLDPDSQWLAVHHKCTRLPDQGWKLHVSAGVPTAEETLRRVLPVLLTEPLTFKVAASASRLAALNDGTGALSQIGKFITVFPSNDDQAVHLAERLAEATAGLEGPAIPSDRRLRPAGVVHYRYGSFGGTTIQLRTGEVAFALRSPTAVLEPDVRGLAYRPPTWAIDPFEAAGVAHELPTRPALVGDRFLILGELYRSARGGIYLGVDLDSPQTCVLKSAEAGALMAPGGHDARDQLRHEVAVLEQLATDPRFPSVIALVEHGDDLYMAMSDLKTTTLESHVLTLAARGCTVSLPQVVAWGRELADMLSTVHAAGLVYRDLKSTNVAVTSDMHLRLVDFEQACEPGHSGLAPRGTRGYMSPQQVAGEPAHPTDDVYGLGAMLAYIATGAEPSQAPRPLTLLDRPLELLNASIAPDLAAVITRALAADATERFPTIDAVDAALAAVGHGIQTTGQRSEHRMAADNETAARRRCRDLGRRLGDTICWKAKPVGDAAHVAWISDHQLGLGIHGRDVNTGAAGTLLALAELVLDLGEPAHREVLSRGAGWLANAPRPAGEPLPGLYVGEAGVAAGLLRAAQVLGDAGMLQAAIARGRATGGMPHASPDLFNGSAGRLRFHLLCWDETHDSEDLRYAIDAAEHILATAEDVGDGARCWKIPSGYGDMSGHAYLGYAHGAAGIADALLDLVDVTGDERFLDTARGAGHWVSHMSEPALNDGSGLRWPTIEGAQSAAAFWCHGSAGIGRFWLHAAAHDVPGAADIAARAVATTAWGVRWAPPPQCHGLAGAIELVLDAYQASGDPARLAEARALGRLLEAFSLEDEGHLVWPSESPQVVSPDYNVGYAGVATALLRLADPERRPHGLSRQAFRYPGTPLHGSAQGSSAPTGLPAQRGSMPVDPARRYRKPKGRDHDGSG